MRLPVYVLLLVILGHVDKADRRVQNQIGVIIGRSVRMKRPQSVKTYWLDITLAS